MDVTRGVHLREEKQEDFTAVVIEMSALKKKIFPAFLLAFQVVFLVLFGVFVTYDKVVPADGSAGAPTDSCLSPLESTRSTAKTYPFFQDVHVMIFIGFGFLMTFLRRYGYGSVGFNLLMAAFAVQWSTITSGLFTFIEQSHNNVTEYKISVSIESMVASDFAAAAVLITFGAVLGKASPFQMIIIAFFEIMFYSANEALNVHVLKAADIGGSMLIHTFGAYFGIAVSFALYKKKAWDHPKNSSVYHSDLFAMIGTLFLWLFWPSFNGGLASGDAQYRAIINTYYAMVASVLAAFITSMFVDVRRKIDMVHVQNATLAGGVAVGSVADMAIQPWGALLVGCAAGFLSVLGYRYLSPLMGRIFLQDTCGVHNLHGMPGVLSAVASAIAAGVAEVRPGSGKIAYGIGLFDVFPARAPENTTLLMGVDSGDGRNAGIQAGYQLALLFSTLIISILGGLLTGVIVRFLPFEKTEESFFYDDAPYWQLPDDADRYLPPDEDENEAPKPRGADPKEATPVPSGDDAKSPVPLIGRGEETTVV